MNENIRIMLTVSIPALVTIIGFAVSYFLNRRSFHEEINKQKSNIQLDKISDVPYEILSLFNDMHDKRNKDKMTSDFNSLLSKIFAYGSKDAILIAANMQEFNFTSKFALTDCPKDYTNKIMTYFILLLCQVKYDLTGIKVNPGYWYKIKFTDYRTMKPGLKSSANEIVSKLRLKNFLLIS